MMPVKICGITNLKDAQMAVNYGASALGFIFYDQSPRCIQSEIASQIVAELNGQVAFVGVFVNEKLDQIHAIADEVGLNFIQLHGDETPEYCQKVQLSVIKVFRVSPEFDGGMMDGYNVHAFLLDTYKKGTPGGTGEIFNWNIIGNLSIDIPIILSGGLDAGNIKNGINIVMPSAVDINSGVESRPGIKDEKKMDTLFKIIKNIDSTVNPFDIPVFKGGYHEL